MTRPRPSRRDFIRLTGSAMSGAWLSMHLPAIEAAGLYAREAVQSGKQVFETLEAGEARILTAIAARFFPTDDTPGATEAGVVYFMDRSLGSFFDWMLPAVRGTLEALAEEVSQGYPEAEDFADLGAVQQDELMGWLANEQTFMLLQILTACGMFGDPSLGGNRNGVGWDLVGFESAPAWDPPFGYYDRQYVESGGDNGLELEEDAPVGSEERAPVEHGGVER